MWYVIGGIAVLVFAFIAWRRTSVARGMRQRDERILQVLDPIGHKLETGQTVTPAEVLDLAQRPELRFILFAALKHMKHPELIPSDFLSPIDQAKSALAYWLMHPNELQDPPEKIEHIQEVIHPMNGQDATFHVFRYRMPESHWAAKDGWLLGLTGPMDDKAEPYSFLPSACSRASDTEGRITPEELVKWYVDLLKKKGLAA